MGGFLLEISVKNLYCCFRVLFIFISGGYMLGIIITASILLGSAGVTDSDLGSYFGPVDFYIEDGCLFRTSLYSQRLEIPGYVTAFFKEGECLYFISKRDGFYFTGILSPGRNYIFNTGIEAFNDCRVKVVFNFGAFYFSILNNSDHSSTLYRFSPDSNNLQSIDGIIDFSIVSGDLLLLKEGCLDYNGVKIPIMLKANKIRDILDNRLVLLTDGEDVDVCDIYAAKSIYQYKEGIVYDKGDSFNLLLEFYDLRNNEISYGEEEKLVYYNITVNGQDIGRTETGYGSLVKQMHAKVNAGNYNIITAERWELDKSRGRYLRVNNINQPEEIRIFVPLNRVVRIEYNYDGNDYNILQNVYITDEEDM